MTLRADDGTFLETKEGAVLDKEGNTLLDTTAESTSNGFYGENRARTFGNMKVFNVSPWMIPLLAIGLVMAVALGTVIIGGAFCLILAVWLLRTIFRALSGRSF